MLVGNEGYMKNSKIVKVAAIILSSVVLDIVLHVVTSAYSTMPENPDFSLIASTLGTEITASLWALCAFSGVAFVFFRIQNEIPGKGVEKGLRYGTAIAMLWIFAMLEGVPLFGNPLIKEFVVGLSDAIPVLVMGVLLSTIHTGKGEDNPPAAINLKQKIKAVLIFTGIFLTGRYIAYFSGVIQSGNQTRPFPTLIWTLLMGVIIGVVFILLSSNTSEQSLRHKAVKFGLLIFGLNWAAFLLFMPLLFSGYMADAFLRMIIDITLVVAAACFASVPGGEALRKRMSDKQTVTS